MTDTDTDIALLMGAQLPEYGDLTGDQRSAMQNLVTAMAPNTRKAYMADLRDYLMWFAGEKTRKDPLDPAAIAAYLEYAHDAGLATSSIKRRVAAIHKAFQARVIMTNKIDYDPTKHPVVKVAIAAIATKDRERIHEEVPKSVEALRGPAEPLTGELLVQLLASIEQDRPADQRDIAMLLIGWFGALRPSELVAIRTPDVKVDAAGVIITIPASKTDPKPTDVAIAAHPRSRWDPATHLAAWVETLTAQSADNGGNNKVLWAATTRSGTLVTPVRPIAVRTLTDMFKRRARAAGIDTRRNIEGETVHVKFSNHSLRAGFITEANNRGLPEADIMRHSRHKSIAMMRHYDRHSGHFGKRNPSTSISL